MLFEYNIFGSDEAAEEDTADSTKAAGTTAPLEQAESPSRVPLNSYGESLLFINRFEDAETNPRRFGGAVERSSIESRVPTMSEYQHHMQSHQQPSAMLEWAASWARPASERPRTAEQRLAVPPLRHVERHTLTAATNATELPHYFIEPHDTIAPALEDQLFISPRPRQTSEAVNNSNMMMIMLPIAPNSTRASQFQRLTMQQQLNPAVEQVNHLTEEAQKLRQLAQSLKPPPPTTEAAPPPPPPFPPLPPPSRSTPQPLLHPSPSVNSSEKLFFTVVGSKDGGAFVKQVTPLSPAQPTKDHHKRKQRQRMRTARRVAEEEGPIPPEAEKRTEVAAPAPPTVTLYPLKPHGGRRSHTAPLPVQLPPVTMTIAAEPPYPPAVPHHLKKIPEQLILATTVPADRPKPDPKILLGHYEQFCRHFPTSFSEEMNPFLSRPDRLRGTTSLPPQQPYLEGPVLRKDPNRSVGMFTISTSHIKRVSSPNWDDLALLPKAAGVRE